MSSPLSSITPMSRTVGVNDTADPHRSIVDIAEGERTVVERKPMASVFVSLSRKKKKKKCFYLTHHTFYIIHIYPC